MTIQNQAQYDEIRSKYKGKTATDRVSGEKYLIEDVYLILYREANQDVEFAIAILSALDANYRDYRHTPPSVDYLLHYFSISD